MGSHIPSSALALKREQIITIETMNFFIFIFLDGKITANSRYLL
jgi:hypothetical protein